MPEYLAPGVYLEEIASGPKPIEGVSTSTTAFVGPTRRGPLAGARAPGELNSFSDFEKTFGGLTDLNSPPKMNYVAHAAKAFFDEGGRRLFVARVKSPRTTGKAPVKDWQEALDALATWPHINLVAAPGSTEQGRLADAIQSRLIAHVEAANAGRFVVLDIPNGKTPSEAVGWRKNFDSKHAAFYYPWVTVPDPSGKAGAPAVPPSLTLPPSGFICGIYARSDLERGVFKAPANEVLRSATGLERQITAPEQETLNPAGVNCLRYFAGKGFCVWGARTASPDPDWKYVNVRRYFDYLERSIDQGTQWAVFEPNGEKLWAMVRQTVSNFLSREWRNGGLQGRTAEDAFFVRCDRTTMTQSDLDNGRLICLIGVAPVKPAEFVIFRIGQWTAEAHQ
jgi:phage tail sheath protein FI